MLNTIQRLRDNEGYIVNPAEWNEQLAHELAAKEALELNEEYWSILNFMRDYWNEHKVAPDVRHDIINRPNINSATLIFNGDCG